MSPKSLKYIKVAVQVHTHTHTHTHTYLTMISSLNRPHPLRVSVQSVSISLTGFAKTTVPFNIRYCLPPASTWTHTHTHTHTHILGDYSNTLSWETKLQAVENNTTHNASREREKQKARKRFIPHICVSNANNIFSQT